MAVELMAEGMGGLSFALLSSRLGIDHCIHVAANVPSEHGVGFPDMEVNPEAVLALLEGAAGWR